MIQATVETRVRFAETDAMGVTYHGNYLPWFEMARVALLDQLGTPYRELEKSGFLLPVLEAGLKYHRPSHFDDRVRITVQLLDAVADRSLWAQRYDRELTDLLTLQGELASAIVSPVLLLLTSTQTSQGEPGCVDGKV